MKTAMRFMAALALPVLLTGCGYTTSSFSYGGQNTLYVGTFLNKINVSEEVTDTRMYIGYRSGMERDVTAKIIDRFIIDGHFEIVQPENAVYTLYGELLDFRKEGLRFDGADNVIEFRVKIVVNLKLTDKDGKVVFEQNNFTGETTYKTQGQYAKSEAQAIDDAINDLAVRVIDKIVEGW